MKTATKNSKLIDAFSGVKLSDVNETIINNLSKDEKLRYVHAVQKATQAKVLNLKDLKLLDKIDGLTMQAHGMCLKDSLITKARIKACNKYGRKFIDRDNLEQHMQTLYAKARVEEVRRADDAKLGYLLIDKLGENAAQKFAITTGKIMNEQTLTIADLHLIADVERVINEELNASMLSDTLINAVCKAGTELGVSFLDLLKQKLH